MELEELTTSLIKQEFGNLVLDIRFSGPFEFEDLDVDVILNGMPEDLPDRSYSIWNHLQEKGFNVLIGYEQPFEKFDEATIEKQMERQRREVAKLLEKMSEAIHRRELEKIDNENKFISQLPYPLKG